MCFWANEKSTAEVDFLLQLEGRVIPIEVKAGESLQAKSFKFFCEKYHPETAVRTSLSDYREEEWMINLPLYAIGTVGALRQSSGTMSRPGGSGTSYTESQMRPRKTAPDVLR